MAPCEIDQRFHPSSEESLIKKTVTVKGIVKREGQDADSLPSGVREVVTNEDYTKVIFEDEGLPESVRFLNENGKTVFSQYGNSKLILIHEEGKGIGWTIDGPKTEDGEPGSPIGVTVIHRRTSSLK